MNPGQITAISIVGTIFVLFPIAIAMARNIWRRGSRQVAPPMSGESAQRMERLEQAIDAISIEVERISEGQRFMTRLLTEGSAPALSVGQKMAEPIRLPDRDSLAHISRDCLIRSGRGARARPHSDPLSRSSTPWGAAIRSRVQRSTVTRVAA